MTEVTLTPITAANWRATLHVRVQRGYGRGALHAIGEWLAVEHPSITVVGLNVLAENAIAFALYRSVGFVPVGTTLDDQTITLARATELRSPPR